MRMRNLGRTGLEVGWIIWHLDQIRAKGVGEPRASYANFPVKASAYVECGVCVKRCPFDVDILGKIREAAAVFERQAA